MRSKNLFALFATTIVIGGAAGDAVAATQAPARLGSVVEQTHALKRHQAARKSLARRLAGSSGLLANGSFESSLSGWTGYKAFLSLASGGTDGVRSAKATYRGPGGDYSISPTKAQVSSTVAGTSYTASGSIRSAIPGRTICARLREWSSAGLAGSAQSCLVATSAWQALPPVGYRALGSGRELDLYVFQGSAQLGDSFQVDDLSLVPAAPTQTQAPVVATPTAPAPTAPSVSRLYADDAPINTRIAGTPSIDPNSPAMVAQLVSEASKNGWPISVKQWTSTVYYADASTPRYDVPLTHTPYLGSKFASVPIPADAKAPGDSDGGVIVLDRSTGCEYDIAQAKKLADGSWSAHFVNALSMSGSGIYPSAESPSASGFASNAGKITAEELAAGRIDHAITFGMNATKAGGPVGPAQGSDGWSTAAGAIPEGAHLQLDPSLDLDSLPLTPWQKIVARAMQEYGLYLVDTGGTFAISAQNAISSKVAYPWGDVDYAHMPTALVSKLRVLTTGPQRPDVNWSFVQNACAKLK